MAGRNGRHTELARHQRLDRRRKDSDEPSGASGKSTPDLDAENPLFLFWKQEAAIVFVTSLGPVPRRYWGSAVSQESRVDTGITGIGSGAMRRRW